MAKKQLKVAGWAWYSKNQRAINIGMADKDGKIDNDLKFVIFVDNLEAVRKKERRSACVYVSQPFQRAEVEAPKMNKNNCVKKSEKPVIPEE